MCVRIRQNKSSIKAKLGVQPPVSMRRIFQMIFQEQLHIANKVLCSWCWISQMLLPIVEAAAVNPHGFT
jgi:hypothetical protein